jgi:hypothetical protein
MPVGGETKSKPPSEKEADPLAGGESACMTGVLLVCVLYSRVPD